MRPTAILTNAMALELSWEDMQRKHPVARRDPAVIFNCTRCGQKLPVPPMDAPFSFAYCEKCHKGSP